MTLRLHLPRPWSEGQTLDLPPGAARHVQVWRLQPGDSLRLFDGEGVEHETRVLAIGRQRVSVLVGSACPAVPELALHVTLAVGLMANERMDTLVEKATELGVARIVPLLAQRSVLRLSGERAGKRREHWQAVAAAASGQCGRAVVPLIDPVQELGAWLSGLDPRVMATRLVLSLAPDAAPPGDRTALPSSALLLSGPEGGLAPEEEAAARAAGFTPQSLGPRTLRADTAPLAWLAWAGLQAAGASRRASAAGRESDRSCQHPREPD